MEALTGDLDYLRPAVIVSVGTGLRTSELLRLKVDHVNFSEARSHNTLVSEDMLERLVKLFELVENFQPLPKPVTKLTPLIESHGRGADNHAGIDDYAFRVTLRNDGVKEDEVVSH